MWKKNETQKETENDQPKINQLMLNNSRDETTEVVVVAVAVAIVEILR